MPEMVVDRVHPGQREERPFSKQPTRKVPSTL